jgi:predicted ester cyclase
VWEEVWHQGQLSRIDDLFTTDFVRHDPLGRELQGTEQYRQCIGSLRAAFPDVHYSMEERLAEGNKVVVRYRFRGTHPGAFGGCPQWESRSPIQGFLSIV